MTKEKLYRLWDEKKTAVANDLFKIGAIKFGAFKLKLHEKNPDAPLSPIYIDLRVLRSRPAGPMTNVVGLFKDMSQGLQFDLYADVPTAATPIVAVLSYITCKPMITPREPKTHGEVGNIDGLFKTGQTALVIDDLITKADSKLEAIRTLEGKGLRVSDVLVLVDREQGGPEQLEKAGYSLHTAFKFSALLQWYLDSGMIDQVLYDKVMSYLAENK